MEGGLHLGSSGLEKRVAQSDTLEKIGFEAQVTRGIQSVFKAQDDFLIWGPASVEIVDKEGDKISVEALDKALPQLLKRARLSLEHTDQIVGRILERFETQEPVEIEINDEAYKRNEFPTSVLDLEDGSPPALYVAGEIFNDTQQSKRAREQIEEGDLTSYSISGEALVTRKQVEEGTVYDDVVDLDLSAVTLCQEGMNQGASYRKVEGEVSDKKLAGENADEDVEKHRNEIPVLQHPVTQDAGGQATAIGKSMTDSETDNSEEKSTPSLEDVAKRLPEEGDIATKADVEEAKTKAVEAFKENALPDGDLATVKYVEQLVEEKFEVSEKDVPEEVLDLADQHGLSPGAVVEILEAADDDEEEMEDDDAIGDDEDEDEEDFEDFEDEEEDEEDVFEEGDEDFEDVEDEEEDFEDFEDEEEDDETVSVEVLEESLPDDVWKVVSEYIELSSSKKSDSDSEDESSDMSDDVAKEVEKILEGDVQGGTAIPTGGEEDQVEKQYSEGEDGDVPDRSPALAHWE